MHINILPVYILQTQPPHQVDCHKSDIFQVIPESL